LGGVVGGLLELAQNGFKIIASNAQAWFSAGNTLFGFGGGFSSALIGAGYLIGFNVGFSLLLGAVIAWGFVLPLLSWQIAAPIHNIQSALNLYGDKIHYIGIGAMLIAGLWTLLMLIKPFYESLQFSLRALGWKNFKTGFYTLPRTERDIPILYTVVSILIMLVLSFFLLQHLFNIPALLLPNTFSFFIILGSVLYILVIGFIAVVICGYFSGLVGVSASPGSAVVIASMLLAALIIRALINFHPGLLTQSQLLNASAMTIIIGAIITGSACIANDNIQDLKVGYIVGATPWKQQVMLLIGVIAAASVVPPIMNLLFNVYGIANVFPRSGMDPSLTLAAPPAAMMAGIVQGVFHHNLPWSLLSIGAGLIFVCIIANQILQRYGLKLSILGIAIGIYLPLASSIPLVIGAFFSLLTSQRLRALLKKTKAGGKLQLDQKHQRCLLLACGLVAGAALMDVVLAIPMGLAHSPDILAIMPANWSGIATALGMLSVVLLGVWFYQLANRQ
jgi:putative OPT family oligopeptide transporter